MSYVLIPLLLFTAFILTRNEYYRSIALLEKDVMEGLHNYTHEEMLKKASSNPIGLYYFMWFLVFYLLAITYRRNANKHARYMVATALTLTGPTIDRILGIHFGLSTIHGISSFVVSFMLIDLMLGLLLYLDYKYKRDTKALWICLFVNVLGQLSYFIFPLFDAWAYFMELIMLPKPSID